MHIWITFAQKKSKRRPKNKSRHLEVNQPLLTSLAKFSLFYLSRFGGRKKKMKKNIFYLKNMSNTQNRTKLKEKAGWKQISAF